MKITREHGWIVDVESHQMIWRGSHVVRHKTKADIRAQCARILNKAGSINLGRTRYLPVIKAWRRAL